jgi:hypothetical protein
MNLVVSRTLLTLILSSVMGQISVIKKYSCATDTVIEIPENLTVNKISNFPVKNTENKPIFFKITRRFQ